LTREAFEIKQFDLHKMKKLTLGPLEVP